MSELGLQTSNCVLPASVLQIHQNGKLQQLLIRRMKPQQLLQFPPGCLKRAGAAVKVRHQQPQRQGMGLLIQPLLHQQLRVLQSV